MKDSEVLDQIEKLVAEEHRLWRAGDSGGLDPKQHERLQEVKVQLDRCWDLLRQRRAHEEFGQDPDEASLRDAETVKGYEQ